MDWFKKIFKSYPESKIREDDGGGYYSHPDHHRLNDDNQVFFLIKTLELIEIKKCVFFLN